jgi:hypothetical protein
MDLSLPVFCPQLNSKLSIRGGVCIAVHGVGGGGGEAACRWKGGDSLNINFVFLFSQKLLANMYSIWHFVNFFANIENVEIC